MNRDDRNRLGTREQFHNLLLGHGRLNIVEHGRLNIVVKNNCIMATPNEKLAQSLEVLRTLQEEGENAQLKRKLYPKPQKDGLDTAYIDGTVLSGSWASRIEQWEQLIEP